MKVDFAWGFLGGIIFGSAMAELGSLTALVAAIIGLSIGIYAYKKENR